MTYVAPCTPMGQQDGTSYFDAPRCHALAEGLEVKQHTDLPAIPVAAVELRCDLLNDASSHGNRRCDSRSTFIPHRIYQDRNVF